MSKPPRRTVLGLFGVGTAGVATYAFRGNLIPGQREAEAAEPSPQPVEPAADVEPPRTIAEENRLAGSKDWIPNDKIPMASGDRSGDIMGYASTTSVGQGEVISFHVSVRSAPTYRIAVYRIGDYGGTGARLMTTSDTLRGLRRLIPESDPRTGAIECKWPVSWQLRIPESWMSGLYQAVFTADNGYRSSTPFVVREPRRTSDILCVIPFATYQAYNMWPKDKRTGKNLYRGYLPDGKLGGAEQRAFKVSFDRPYSGAGTPSWFNMDTAFARWLEASGRDVTYASSLDLHDGTIDPSQYGAVFFPGHDEYWSRPMFDSAKKAVDAGKHLAFLGANNVYFHVRMEPSSTGVTNRLMACYKSAPDPTPDAAGPTSRWREIHKDRRFAEQGLLGIQFNGIVQIDRPAPMIIKEASHWLWAGTGLREGDKLPGMVGIEADAYDPKSPSPQGARRTLLAVSPYTDRRPGVTWPTIQHTALTEYPNGAMVFAAGTFHWPLALVDDDLYLNTRVKQRAPREALRKATDNLINRMLQKRV